MSKDKNKPTLEEMAQEFLCRELPINIWGVAWNYKADMTWAEVAHLMAAFHRECKKEGL